MESKIKLSRILITTLIPLFLLFNFSNFVNSEENAETIYETGSVFTAGSTVFIHYYHEDDDFTLPIGNIYMHYELVDANGDTVYKWIKKPKWYYYSATRQYAEDYFEFKIPAMMGMIFFEERPEGTWTLKTGVYDATGDVDYSSRIDYKLYVQKGNILDNLFAPIYIYKGYEIFGIEITNMRITLPPIGYLIAFILFIILVVLLVKYIKFAYKEGGEIIKRSNRKIKKEIKNIRNVKGD